jgi:hypothetical protein
LYRVLTAASVPLFNLISPRAAMPVRLICIRKG